MICATNKQGSFQQPTLGRDQYGRMGYFKSENNLIGEFVDIKVDSTSGISLYGDVVEE